MYIYIYIYKRESSVCMCCGNDKKQNTQILYDEFSNFFNTSSFL